MRADKFFAPFFSSRTKAAEAIGRGWIKVNGRNIKPSDEVGEEDEVEWLMPEERFVSNGGYKLSKALKAFSYDCGGKIFADLGASTGGFTDCLLQNGAKKVYCIDVGESLLSPVLAEREEVVVMSDCNARYLSAADFADVLDGCTIDVSFISLKHILPAARAVLPEGADVFALIKPQFECEGKHIGKSGIVNKSAHPAILSAVIGCAESLSLFPQAIVNAPVREKKNIEYVVWLKKGVKGVFDKKDIEKICRNPV